jgi:uncharacterized protein YqgC (DUF456 family)
MEALATVPNLHLILASLVYLSILVGVGLILFVPFFPGLAVILGGVLLYVGVMSAIAKTLSGIDVVTLVALIVVSVIGMTSAFWTEKLGLRFTYMSQQIMWGAIIGSLVGMFVFGMVGMLLGLIVGCMAMEMRGGRSPQESVKQGVSALMSMLGPRGFQLVMALVAASLVLSGRVVGL